MNNKIEVVATINSLSSRAAQALQMGKEKEAIQILGQILQINPNHVSTLNELGKYSLKKNEFDTALSAFSRIVAIDGNQPQQWINLALVHRALQNESEEETAIQNALIVDPTDLLALIMRADLFDRQGKQHQAVRAYGAAANVAPTLDRLHPSLHQSVIYAQAYKKRYEMEKGEFLDVFLQKYFESFNGEDLSRFQLALDIMLGRRKRFDSKSHVFHYPNLTPIEFFKREEFPWLNNIEEKTDTIRTEFIEIMQEDSGFIPYLQYGDDLPLNQFAELNNSPNWSAFHLIRNGVLQEENVKKCPKTMGLLKNVPQPIQLNRTPSVMFSILKPKTHIPPHTGVSNVRLVTHIPLIIPEKCEFRVGNQIRNWEMGKALIFDDTIEHEAWNNSDNLRAVLIFDIWHPQLSEIEREMITQLAKGIEEFQIIK